MENQKLNCNLSIASVTSVQWPVSPDNQPMVEEPVAPVVEPIQPVASTEEINVPSP